MAAMLAAIMSTLDSGMNSMATIYLKEVHLKYINKKMPVTAEVKISRYATFGVGVIAISLGLLLDSSGKWLAQSAAEVGTLFGMIATIILPAFLFAVLSPRANSMLIWLLTFFAIGDNIAMNLWYALSRVSTQTWQPGEAMGWGGPINFCYALIPFIAGIVFILPWCLCKERRRNKWILSLTFAGAFSFGLAQAMLLWVFFSNTMITTEPLGRSFAFGLPSVLIFGFIALNFFPKQAKEKYQGLTLGTINEPLIKL
jgi:Na+/proline symporter